MDGSLFLILIIGLIIGWIVDNNKSPEASDLRMELVNTKEMERQTPEKLETERRERAEVAFNFGKINWEYTLMNSDGSPVERFPPTGTWRPPRR